MSDATATVLSVNVGRPRTVDAGGRRVRSAIWKQPVLGRVRVEGTNVQGDRQADPRVHGGPDKAVYSYASEDYAWWQAELGSPVEDGAFGENLTTRGLDVTGAIVGERWRIGSAVLEVSQPRTPCYKLAMRMGDPAFQERFALANRPGAYLRIVEAGDVGAGDAIEVVERPDHGMSVGDVARIVSSERWRRAELLEVPQLASSWHAWARRR
jgi:MOSC domain-containing protein YiiM